MIFFDIDGTLLDHKGSEYFAVKEFYKVYSNLFNTQEEIFYNLWCKTSDKHFQKYLSGELTFLEQRNERIKELFALHEINLSDEEAAEKFQVYLENYEKNWMIFDDVITCLKKLEDDKLGIISNGDLEQQIYKLERLGIKSCFDIFVTAGDTGIAKPNIKIFEIACDRAGKEPQQCYYIGDEIETDILACQKIGMSGIWINRKNKPTNKFVKQISSLDKLKEAL